MEQRSPPATVSFRARPALLNLDATNSIFGGFLDPFGVLVTNAH
jgi:hypothetical protein